MRPLCAAFDWTVSVIASLNQAGEGSGQPDDFTPNSCIEVIMNSHAKHALILAMALTTAQQTYAQSPAPVRPAVLDPAAIRRDAAKLGEVRGLLSDPDPNVRILTMREIMKSGDPVQRQLAMDAGLTSADASMVELALRAILTNVQLILITVTDMDGKPVTKSNYNASSIGLALTAFDPDTGRFTGNTLSGQLQGNVLSFALGNYSGLLVWEPEAGEFRGTVNLWRQEIEATRKGSWRPR